MQDARISTALPGHPKTKKLIRRLGDGAAWRLVCLFLWAAANRSDGDLTGMSDEDIELAVDWQGDEGVFVSTLVALAFLDGEARARRIHDWAEHNPWAAGSEARSEKSRWAALCKQYGSEQAATMMPAYAARTGRASLTDATGTLGQCRGQRVAVPESAMGTPLAESGSAPSPLPLPSPSPNPNPNPSPNSVGAGVPDAKFAKLVHVGGKKSSAAAKAVTVGIDEIVAAGVDRQHAEDWLKVRRDKRMALTATAWASTCAEATKVGLTPAQAVRIAAERSWAGFLARYVADDSGLPRAGTTAVDYADHPEVIL